MICELNLLVGELYVRCCSRSSARVAIAAIAAAAFVAITILVVFICGKWWSVPARH